MITRHSAARAAVIWTLLAAATALTAQTPPDRLEFGFEQRVRNEDWNNILDYSNNANDEREQIRYRTRVWAQVPVSQDLTAVVGLNQESNQKLGQVTKFDEVIFDQAYLDYHPSALKGWALRVGRQNIMRGEGFVLFDGTSGDGSRTMYFNAAVLSRSFAKSRLEFMGILNPARDRFLPSMNDCHKLLTEWNESALGAYYTNTSEKNALWEAYYFYKKEYGDTRSPLNRQFQPDRHVQTAGARAVVKLARSATATGEFAEQWGFQRPARNLSAWGGYGYLKKALPGRWKPYAQMGYWAMSDGWDPLFSRWPKWSELVIYSEMQETGASYWTNMRMTQLEAGCQPSKFLNGRLTWYHANAFHPFHGGPAMFGSGTERGDNMQALLTFNLNSHWKGHALYEALLPGDFYNSGKYAYFVRFELAYQVRIHPGQPTQ
jgi:hypothetical protein